MEKVLSSQPLDLDRLGKDEFGIFRLVTDGPGDSVIEQELLSLLKKFHLFRQAIKGRRIVSFASRNLMVLGVRQLILPTPIKNSSTKGGRILSEARLCRY